ncbi:hypothetical protein D3C87_1989710 [compost metagenome]
MHLTAILFICLMLLECSFSFRLLDQLNKTLASPTKIANPKFVKGKVSISGFENTWNPRFNPAAKGNPKIKKNKKV